MDPLLAFYGATTLVLGILFLIALPTLLDKPKRKRRKK